MFRSSGNNSAMFWCSFKRSEKTCFRAALLQHSIGAQKHPNGFSQRCFVHNNANVFNTCETLCLKGSGSVLSAPRPTRALNEKQHIGFEDSALENSNKCARDNACAFCERTHSSSMHLHTHHCFFFFCFSTLVLLSMQWCVFEFECAFDFYVLCCDCVSFGFTAFCSCRCKSVHNITAPTAVVAPKKTGNVQTQ